MDTLADLRLIQQALHVAREAVLHRDELTSEDWAELGLLLDAALAPLNEGLGYQAEPDTDWKHL